MVFWLLLCGFLGGILGGMGMGGGTVLIPLLTLFLGVPQKVASLANLIAFLPMALFSLSVHQRNGLLKTGNKGEILMLILPAATFSGFGAVVVLWLPNQILRKLFGAFLVGLALWRLLALFDSLKDRHRK